MAYTPGWNPDKQSRVARHSQDQGYLDGPLPLISRGGLPSVTTFGYPNPSFAGVTAQNRVARTATDVGQRDSLLPNLLNRDQVYGVAGQVPNYELQQALPPVARRPGLDVLTQADASEFWLFGALPTPPPGAQATILPSVRLRSALENLSFLDPSEVWLFGTDAMVSGRQSVDLPPRAASRARDYSLAQAFPLSLIGADATNPGQQQTELAPRPAARARDYSWTAGLVPNLVGQDSIVGGSSTTLPPRAALRARDYSWSAELLPALVGQDSVVPGKAVFDLPTRRPMPVADLYTQAAASRFWLIDAMASGQQSTELPPRGAARARDYSVSQPVLLNLVGQDSLTVGAQLSGPAPAGSRRASTLTEPGTNLTLIAAQAPPVIPQGQSAGLSELPPRGPARARDYSVTQPVPLNLLGQDQVYGGAGKVPAYDWSYLPAKPRYQQGTGEAIQDLLSTLLATVAAAPLPPGAQTLDLAPRLAPRARDYSWVWALQLALLGKDSVNPGVQIFDVPRGPRRAVDYTFLASFPLELIGADALAPGSQATDLPRGAQRARDYSWLGWFPLELRGQDAFNPGDQLTDLPPRGPARLREYSIVVGFTAGTFAPEKIPTGTQVWGLTPNTAARLRDYSLTNALPVALTAPVRNLVVVVGEPETSWRMRQPISAWAIDAPQK